MAKDNTYQAIATTTATGSTTSVTLSSIPGTYTDLVLILQGGPGSSGNSLYVQINSDTGSNYSTTDIWGDGTNAESGRTTSATFIRILGRGIGASNNLSNSSITSFMNYSNTTTYKTLLNRSNPASAGATATVGLWRSTSAITSLTVTSESGNLISGSTFTLYGIKAA
jgi:hypothetical protein